MSCWQVRAHSTRLRDFLLRAGGAADMRLDRLLDALPPDAPAPHCTPDDHEVAPPAGKWYYISDSRVNEVVSEANVLRSQAYLLFYERIY